MNRVFGKPLTQVLLGFTATLVAVGAVSSEALAKPQKPLTWKQDVAQGDNVFRRTLDYNLPAPWRNGFVYDIQGANWVGKYVLKPGLAQYPVPKDGLNQIEWADGDRLVKSGKAIKFFWNGGNSGAEHANDTEVRFDSTGGCLRNTCLTAPFISKAQIRRILLSERSIQQKSLPKTLFLEPESQDKADVKSASGKIIQRLPNGNHFYGAHGDANGIGKQYVLFRKSGSSILGFKYRNSTDVNTCFAATMKGTTLVNAVEFEQEYNPQLGRQAWQFHPQTAFDLNTLQGMRYRIALQKAPSFAQERLKECITVFSSRKK